MSKSVFFDCFLASVTRARFRGLAQASSRTGRLARKTRAARRKPHGLHVPHFGFSTCQNRGADLRWCLPAGDPEEKTALLSGSGFYLLTR